MRDSSAPQLLWLLLFQRLFPFPICVSKEECVPVLCNPLSYSFTQIVNRTHRDVAVIPPALCVAGAETLAKKVQSSAEGSDGLDWSDFIC